MPNPPQQYGWASDNPEITGDITSYAYPPQPPSNEVWGGKGYADLPPEVQRYIATAPSITDAQANRQSDLHQNWTWPHYRGAEAENTSRMAEGNREDPYYQMMSRNIYAQQGNYPRSEESQLGRMIQPNPLTPMEIPAVPAVPAVPGGHGVPGIPGIPGDTQPRLYRLPNGQYIPMHRNPDGTLSIPTQTQMQYGQGNQNSFYWNPPGYRTPQPSIWEYLDNANQWAFPMGPVGMDTAVLLSGGYPDQSDGGGDVTAPGPGKKP